MSSAMSSIEFWIFLISSKSQKNKIALQAKHHHHSNSETFATIETILHGLPKYFTWLSWNWKYSTCVIAEKFMGDRYYTYLSGHKILENEEAF